MKRPARWSFTPRQGTAGPSSHAHAIASSVILSEASPRAQLNRPRSFKRRSKTLLQMGPSGYKLAAVGKAAHIRLKSIPEGSLRKVFAMADKQTFRTETDSMGAIEVPADHY